MKAGNELRQIVALHLVDELGPVKFKNLIAIFGSASAILEADESELVKVDGISASRARAIKNADLFQRADEEIKKAGDNGVGIITCFDDRYPALLKEVYDPPIVLYVKGQLPSDKKPKIAVVGSRIASFYGLRMAKSFSRDLAQAGVVVVSGLALGIDAAAHQGALEGGGLTLAVLGGGLNKIYPRENMKLAAEIIKNGALISEYPMDFDARPGYFPIRNRIISGLSRGVLVVEAREKSGALITADAALAEGREVFAVPGNADAARSAGPNKLLKQGAKVVTDAQDILEELGMEKAGGAGPKTDGVPLTEDESRILSFLDGEPLHVDELIERSGLSAREAVSALSLMELKGVLKQLPGKHFVRN
ncbi:MAG: DNA-processing protein DprA [Candidatus Omnitrophota bacterium]